MTWTRKQLDALITAVCDGTAGPEQMQRLAQLMRDDQEAMDQYLLQVDLHAQLATDLTWPLDQSAEGQPAKPAELRLSRRGVPARGRSWTIATASACAALVLAMTALACCPLRPAPEIRTIVLQATPALLPSDVHSDLGTVISSDEPVPPELSDAVEHRQPLQATNGIGSLDSRRPAQRRLLSAPYRLPLEVRRTWSASLATRTALRRDKQRIFALPAHVPSERLVAALDAPSSLERELQQSAFVFPDDEIFLKEPLLCEPPLWRRDLASRWSLRVESLELQWRKTDEP